MFKFLLTLICWLATHYNDMPSDFKSKFPLEDIKDFALVLSNISVNSKLYSKYHE